MFHRHQPTHANFLKAVFSVFIKCACVALFFAAAIPEAHAAIPVYSTYKFQRNSERAIRKETRFIILHTTEGPAKGSGEKLKRNGEAHYMIDEAGRIYSVVDRRRVAYHCGLSMWDGKTSLDNSSIGIEMVGYHNKNLTAAQIKSLKSLIAELKKTYPSVTDNRILTHSMVAYGSPNQWHKRNHRGRKRCGMLMATSSIRTQLGIKSKPSYDPDVRARRLVVADQELFNLLYRKSTTTADDTKAITKYTKNDGNNIVGPRRSAWDIARDAYNSASTVYIFPNGTRKTGDKITDWKSMPKGTKVIMSSDADENPQPKPTTAPAQLKTVPAPIPNVPPECIIGPKRSAWDIAKSAYNSASTLYILPDGTRKNGAEIKDWKSLRAGTKVILPSLAYSAVATNSPSATAPSAAATAAKNAVRAVTGDAWKSPSTFYITPEGKYFRGSEMTVEKLAALDGKTKVLSGYKVAGPVTATTIIYNITEGQWKKSSTFYLAPNGKLTTGDKVDATKIRSGTMIFFKGVN